MIEMTDVRRIIKLLSAGCGEIQQRTQRNPVAVLVQTILSQNTSDKNSRPAFQRLLASFRGWQEVADASVDQICQVIKTGGLGMVKAGYIKRALQEIKRQQGTFDLGFLNDLPLDEARDWLMQLPGVGMKTASVVLLFSLDMPALPVDTHVFRVSKRLGLIDSRITVNEAHRILERLVPAGDVYKFHVLLIEHGRRTCRAQWPHCTECLLGSLCPSYEKFVGQPWAA
ncbi:MAG TPA: endonuclease III [Dehalococcoidia bacterium]|jgi:endonuclease-3